MKLIDKIVMALFIIGVCGLAIHSQTTLNSPSFPNGVYLGGVDQNATARALIGMDSSGRVSLDPDARGSIFAGALTVTGALTNTGAITPSGGITGVTSGVAASAGIVGQVISSTVTSGATVALATTSASTITSITLTAGDWDVWGIAQYVAASTTSVTELVQGTSSTSGCVAAPVTPSDTFYTSFNTAANILAPGHNPALNLPTNQYNVSTSTVVCLEVVPRFTASTLTGYGSLYARRRR